MKARLNKHQIRRNKLKLPDTLYVKVNDGWLGHDDYVGSPRINKLFEMSSLGKPVKVGIYKLEKVVEASGVIQTK